MNVLVIKNNTREYEIIYKELCNTKNNIALYDVPDLFDEASLAALLEIIRSESIGVVFSVDFYPTISLACGVMQLEYIVWLVEMSNISYLDYSIRNSWNRIYSIDRHLCEELKEHGVNATYLPLSPENDYYEADVNSSGQDGVLIWGDCDKDVDSISGRMELLKDSTKGYVDSMIEQHRNNLIKEDIYVKFADYIKEDIEQNYPVNNSNLEEPSKSYDRLYIYASMDGYAYPYILRLLSPYYGEIDRVVATDKSLCDDLIEYGIKTISRERIRENAYKELERFKLVIFFPNAYENVITQDMWDAMAKGVFVMCPKSVDLEFLGKDKPVTFKNKRELDILVRHYLENDEERYNIAERVKNKVLSLDQYTDKLQTMIGESNEKAD